MPQTSLYIPEPCHEDWNKMTPTQQGKFCSACSKQVIDFSLMSDRQILNFLSNQPGRLCGRFDAEQLQRALVETKIKKKKSWWMALTMPLLFLFNRSEAQESDKIVGNTSYNFLPPKEDIGKVLVGKIKICEPTKKITIRGKVVDENGHPLAFASIMQKGKNQGTSTDSAGNFSIDIIADNLVVTIAASYVGYEAAEKVINIIESNMNIDIVLKQVIAGEVLVVGAAATMLPGTLGGLSVCSEITALQKIDTTIRKAFNISAFKIYPNPALKGSTIQIKIKQADEYQLQLFNNQSRLITVQHINTNSNHSNTGFPVPANIAAGIYYLRLINEQTKKSYTEKLIIQ